jgi:NADPH2:quinone reductase
MIEVHYAGVNRPDLLQRAGKYNRRPCITGAGSGSFRPRGGAGRALWNGASARRCARWYRAAVAPDTAPHRPRTPADTGLDLATAALPESWYTVWINLMHHGALRAMKPY